MTLVDHLPATSDPDSLFDAFSAWAEGRGLRLYPAQEDALIEVVSGSNVIVSTPTGSGKSLVAAGAHFAALAARAAAPRTAGRRAAFTPPPSRRSSRRSSSTSAPRSGRSASA